MAIENETADQVVRMILQGSEVVLRLTGQASMRIATMIYSALQGDVTTKGRATLWEFIKSGREQTLLRIPDEYLKAFTKASKKFGFPFVIMKDKSNKDGNTDIMIYSSDASKVNRVIESMKLNIDNVGNMKAEVENDTLKFVKPIDMTYRVPLSLIDGIPDPQTQDKRLLDELMKYASKMKASGPQVVEPVGLLCKSDGRYEIIPGQGAKRLMALRLAGYKDAVADISIPESKAIEVKAENVDERPSQERNEAPKTPKPAEKDAPTKEAPQTVNPTMARTSKDPASGQDYGPRSKKDERKIFTDAPENRPSVKKKLDEAKAEAAKRQASKELSKMLEKTAPKPR